MYTRLMNVPLKIKQILKEDTNPKEEKNTETPRIVEG